MVSDNQASKRNDRLDRATSKKGLPQPAIAQGYDAEKQVYKVSQGGDSYDCKAITNAVITGGDRVVRKGDLVDSLRVVNTKKREEANAVTYAKIKYLYYTINESNRDYFVGGHQVDPIKIEDLKNVEWDQLVIDNLGNNNFSINAKKDNKISFWSGINKEWEIDISEFADANTSIRCLGHGFWILTKNRLDLSNGYNQTTTNTDNNIVTTTRISGGKAYYQNAYIFNKKLFVDQPFLYSDINDSEVKTILPSIGRVEDAKGLTKVSETRFVLPGVKYLFEDRLFTTVSSYRGDRVPLSILQASTTSTLSQRNLKISPSGASTFVEKSQGIRILNSLESDTDNKISGISKMVWVSAETIAEYKPLPYEGINSVPKTKNIVDFYEGDATDITDDDFSITKITISPFDAAINENAPTAAIVKTYDTKFEISSEAEENFFAVPLKNDAVKISNILAVRVPNTNETSFIVTTEKEHDFDTKTFVILGYTLNQKNVFVEGYVSKKSDTSFTMHNSLADATANRNSINLQSVTGEAFVFQGFKILNYSYAD